LKQSPNDHKQYQPLTLDNGLRVLLVHNNATKKSAAALAVNVGHFSDPEHRQGLAHFLEHMLFLGTEGYPDGSEYQKFISQHGGSNNAWTATEHTCFFLDINHQYFDEALDRFSQFFTCPLLSQEFIESERENIDAEFKLKLKDDIRRLYDVHKETINPLHPFSKFSVGNSDTLKDTETHCIHTEIKMFYETYYHAGAMTLVLEGPQSLEALKELAQNKFSSIQRQKSAPIVISQSLYLPEHQSIRINVKPVKNDHQLIISFAFPAIDEFYRNKPESLLAYLLGHEGVGSILSVLKANQWSLGLSAGSGINGSNFKDFNISLQLTEEGEEHIDDIVTIIYQYIDLIKEKPLPLFYYEEKQSLSSLAFKYAEKLKPLDSVTQLVINMQHYPEDDYIYGDYAMDGLCPNLIKEFLGYFTPKNMRIIHVSSENTFDKRSQWYDVPYSLRAFKENELSQWTNFNKNPRLKLPAQNPYIVENPAILPIETVQKTFDNSLLIPSCVDKTDGYELWFKQDTTFNVPKGYLYVGIDAPITIESDVNIAMTRLFVDLYSDSIIEEHYDAELAGIQYHLYAHQGGMTLQLSGISEKQNHLLELLLNSIKQHNFTEQHFNLLKEQLVKHWNNSDTSKSISQLFSVLSSSLQPKNPSSADLANAISTVSFQQFNTFKALIFKKISLKVLIHGNWQSAQANLIGSLIKNAFNNCFSDTHIVNTPILDIKSEGNLHLNLVLPDHDYATIIYFPLADKDLSTVAYTMLTSQLLSPLFFQEMRTEKQYGYLVGVGFIPINRYPGLALYIQSPHTESNTLETAINAFIENAYLYVDSMDEDHWQHLKHGLASQLLEKDSSLRIKSQRFWSALCNDETDFSQKQHLINVIQKVSLSDIKQFMNDNLLEANQPDRISLLSFKSEIQTAEYSQTFAENKNMRSKLNKYKRKF
jgi:secreted Zn-dependent insulinase-like peptidase